VTRKTRLDELKSSGAPAKAGPTQDAGRDQNGRWSKGTSGNLEGMRVGTKHRRTELDELLTSAAPDVVAKVVEAAKGGDMPAARLVMDRVLPLRKGAPVQFALPKVASPADVTVALGAVLTAVSQGELSPEEASLIAGLVEAQRRAHELVELEGRVSALEQKAGAP
jgi:hypothetical protein